MASTAIVHVLALLAASNFLLITVNGVHTLETLLCYQCEYYANKTYPDENCFTMANVSAIRVVQCTGPNPLCITNGRDGSYPPKPYAPPPCSGGVREPYDCMCGNGTSGHCKAGSYCAMATYTCTPPVAPLCADLLKLAAKGSPVTADCTCGSGASGACKTGSYCVVATGTCTEPTPPPYIGDYPPPAPTPCKGYGVREPEDCGCGSGATENNCYAGKLCDTATGYCTDAPEVKTNGRTYLARYCSNLEFHGRSPGCYKNEAGGPDVQICSCDQPKCNDRDGLTFEKP